MSPVCAASPIPALLEIFLPAPCPCCQDPLLGHDRGLCAACRSRLVPVSGYRCRWCGGGVDGQDETCLSCTKDPPPFGEVVVWGEYDGVLRHAILALKHGGLDHLATLLAGRLAAKIALAPWLEAIDLIVAVPSHPWHRVRRGFSAAELLASAVGRRVNKPVRHALRKRGLTRQAGLSRARRMQLSEGRFRLNKRARIEDRAVLLIDDVTTTGATLRRAATVLTRGGASEVCCAALAWVPNPRRIG